MKKIVLLISALFIVHSVFADDWFMAQTNSAPVKSVVATSELVEAQFSGKYLYPPINILDGKFENTWCEADENGPGIGESITVEFSEPVSFDEIQIVNGFATKDYYKKNNRVEKILLTQVANKHFQQKEYTLKDDVETWQSIKFDLTQTAQTITIKILDVYAGSKYNDTCLDDIRLLYKGKVIPFTGVEELKKVQEENSKLMVKSTADDFRKQFMNLFEDNDSFFLKSQKGNTFFKVTKDDYNNNRLYISNSGYLVNIKLAGKDYVEAQISDHYDTYWYYRKDSSKDDEMTFSQYDDAVEKGFDYLLLGSQYESGRVDYKLGNLRILKTERVNYVETTTAIIIKIEGKTVYWNGAPYTVLSESQVYDARYWDGP